jgi:hypothetical protein
MKSISYPNDWYKYLVKGDVVKVVKRNLQNEVRKFGEKFTIVENSNGKRKIYYTKYATASSRLDDFIPIKMQKFPELYKENNYEIY